MDNLRLKNFRCFSDTGKVRLAPLTFLLGRNSTGKSSLLRVLPLLKQTVEKYINGAFLWYGESVDLGNFKNVLKQGADIMSISFDIPESDIDIQRGVLQKDKGGNVHCSMEVHSINEKEEFFSSIIIASSKYTLECRFNDILVSELIVGRISSSEFPNEHVYQIGTNSIIPRVLFTDEPWDYSRAAQTEIESILDELNTKTINGRKALSFFESRSRVIKAMEEEGLSREKAERLYDLQVYVHANEIIDSVNRYLFSLAIKIYYTKPIRAIGERYYRYRNVAVNRVDPSGDNLAMYLSNLSPDSLDNLNGFLKSNFHFSVNTRGEGNLEILITAEDGQRNIVDMGFGYTQILPILVTIWDVNQTMKPHAKKQKKGSQMPYYIAIEQPELHLHPKLQYDFAKVIADIVTECKKNGIDLRVIIETHSEYIINKIGELIAQRFLDKDLVSVLLFNKPDEGEQIVRSEFSTDGFLTNWPYGFFDE